MKAYNVADLLNELGWRASCDAQHDGITAAVLGDDRLLDALFADRKAAAIESKEVQP
jgi:hypothetical protein